MGLEIGHNFGFVLQEVIDAVGDAGSKRQEHSNRLI
jgi:hypothetical protein